MKINLTTKPNDIDQYIKEKYKEHKNANAIPMKFGDFRDNILINKGLLQEPSRTKKGKLVPNTFTCAKCNKTKNKEKFYKLKVSKTGYDKACIECRRAAFRNYNKKNRMKRRK